MKVEPIVKTFTVRELRGMHVPSFQRWIITSNLRDLKESIEEVGLLRLPVICKIKTIDQYQCIDGNHLRTIITDWEDRYSDDDLITCIYSEVETESDASRLFKQLNTKGKKLEWVDITNLYMYTNGDVSVYGDIWHQFLGNPKSSEDIVNTPGFTLPTIIDILTTDKTSYREGKPTEQKFYQKRKDLLLYLIEFANGYWDVNLGEKKNNPRPNGGAIISFVNGFFKHELHNNEKFNEGIDWKENFLSIITSIYQSRRKQILNGEVINKDNAGRILENHQKVKKYLKPKVKKNQLNNLEYILS